MKNRVILHFGAVGYLATIYVNEKEVGMHKGGMVSFSFDITDYVKAGVNTICVQAQDDTRDRLNPTGKQSEKYYSYGCFYTRTTGIWQTVWIEFVPQNYIVKTKYTTDIENAVLNIHTSGNFHVISDIFDVLDYEQDVEKFKSYYENIEEGIVKDQIYRNESMRNRQEYNGTDPFSLRMWNRSRMDFIPMIERQSLHQRLSILHLQGKRQ